MKICEDYLLRPPVDILGWPVPVFQQPSWELERATNAIANAETISHAEMCTMIMKRRNLANTLRQPNAGDDQVSLAHCFYYPICRSGRAPRMVPPEEAFPRLYLQYDLGRAFIAER